MKKKMTCKILMPKLLSHLEKRHLGCEMAINSRYLESRFHVCGSTIRRAVLLLRCQGYPICSGQNGYYYAETTMEVQETIRWFERRIQSTAKVKKALNCAMCRMPDCGQTCLDWR